MSRRSSPAFGSRSGQAVRDRLDPELVLAARAVLAGFHNELELGTLRSSQHASLRRLEAALARCDDSSDGRPLSVGEIVGSYREIPVMGGRVS